MNLTSAENGRAYPIRLLKTEDAELDAFLFTLGCYPGENITVISRSTGSFVVAIKDGRYCIDSALAKAILI